MEEIQENSEKSIFPEVREVEPCSWNKCGRGHTWRPTIVLVNCPACTGPVLVRKQENCPICNEPVEEFQIRVDHITAGGGVAKACHGEKPKGEITIVNLRCEHFMEVEKE